MLCLYIDIHLEVILEKDNKSVAININDCNAPFESCRELLIGFKCIYNGRWVFLRGIFKYWMVRICSFDEFIKKPSKYIIKETYKSLIVKVWIYIFA